MKFNDVNEMAETLDLSIIIPVYNEGRKIDQDIRMASQFLKANHLRGEIIITDDGSQDDTVDIPAEIREDCHGRLRILTSTVHYGKGHAVQSGMLEAVGQIVLFVDSGSCIPWHDILTGVDMVRRGVCDIAHGSRILPDSVITRKQPWYRRILSSSFRKFIRILMNIPNHLTDTQCGLKIYTHPVAGMLYRSCLTKGFMFDIEIILRANQAGYRIREFPVTWTSDPDSRLRIMPTLFDTITDLKRIRDLPLD